MQSRLDRHKDNSDKELPSRLVRNKNLYDELNNKIGFEEIPNFDTQTRIELTSLNNPQRSRESYQQLKDYQEIIKQNKEEEEVKEEEIKEEPKVYDINAILEEARKNRSKVDELEKKRKLKNEEYSILSDLNKKYLANDEEKEKPEKEKYEGLEELINTITSKTLVNDIKVQELAQENKKEEGLLDDLVATSVDLQVNVPSKYENTNEPILNEKETVNEEELKQDEEEAPTLEKTIDDSFYTRSMDLSKDDFDLSLDSEQGGAKRVFLIIFVTVILLAIIAVVIYFVLQSRGIKIF